MNYALIDNESVDYNRLVAQEYVAGKGKDKRRARAEVLERVGLAKVARNKVFELSGGEQQRVAVARLLLKPCELVLADEPTGPLDGANRDAVLAQLIEMNEAGKTVVIVTHDPKVAAACPRQVSLPAARVNARSYQLSGGGLLLGWQPRRLPRRGGSSGQQKTGTPRSPTEAGA
jgi:putative ABC transport system ATP-binding protein